jgi:hypothetical protein
MRGDQMVVGEYESEANRKTILKKAKGAWLGNAGPKQARPLHVGGGFGERNSLHCLHWI